LIALLIGILGIANTMAMSVFERTREIGILRALGWKRRQVMILIQLEASVLGLGGGFLGIAVWMVRPAPAGGPAANCQHRLGVFSSAASVGSSGHCRFGRADRRGASRMARRTTFTG
jgi:hypothetical protein